MHTLGVRHMQASGCMRTSQQQGETADLGTEQKATGGNVTLVIEQWARGGGGQLQSLKKVQIEEA